MKISIVIPVYNEAAELAACLSAIACQTVQPFEVIVVDNNSTDASVAVAEQFDFVKIMNESKQGVIHARTRGFNAARGDIIARIDADTVVDTDWVASIQQVFQDVSIDAVSGVANYYNVAAASTFNKVDLFFRRRLARQLKDRVYLWGANMAIRKSAWEKARPDLCCSGNIHEDFDLAIHLQEHGGRVVFDERLQANVSSRRIDVGYLSFMRYVLVSPGTYAKHSIKRRIYMYEVVMLCALFYVLIRILHRGYDASKGSFSLTQLLTSNSVARIDPTTNVA